MAGQSKDYQPLPFWSWNDKLSSDELRRQIRWMHDNGMGGFFMHARGGLKTEYLSEEWMQCIEACCEEAKRLDMQAWLYDENGWPSGFCGGKLLADPKNRDKYIHYSFGPGDVEADVTYLIDENRLKRVHPKKARGKCLNLYMKSSNSTVDILNPAVVDKFVGSTHCQYKARMGQKFSQKVAGFFTDEPQYFRWNTPYTPMLETYFQEMYGENIFDKLGLLFVEKEGYRTFRYRYWCAMQKLMLTNFAKKVYDWCEEHGVKLTGHYIEETSMGDQLMCCGGVMPFYQYEHIPGIDWLSSATGNELSPRQVGSVARQLGKKQVLTESFAACGWDVTPAELRRVAGFQYVNGANRLCHHLVPYSEHGQRKRDYPAHFTKMNPWVKESFREFNDYFTKLGYLLANGEEQVRVAMLHPIRSIYLDYKRDVEGYGSKVCEFEEALQKACRIFSSRGISYDFLDETLMEEHGFVEANTIGCGKCVYTYLVLPKTLTMGVHTEKLIHQFVKNGGKVLLLDDAPKYLEGEPYEYGYLQSNCTLEEIQQMQPFQVANHDTELYYAYRILEGKPFLYIQNSSHTSCYTQTFEFNDETRSFISVDLVSMHTEILPLTVTLHEDEALLLFPTMEEVPQQEDSKEIELQFAEAEVSFDKNYMTVNTVCYSKDGVQYSKPILTNELFSQLLEERYQGKLWLRYDFEIQTLPEQLSIIAEMTETKDCRINGKKLSFTENWEDEKTFQIADITAMLQLGMNSYEESFDWHQSEATYYALFGEGVTESLKNCIAYDSEVEAIYLCGKFGVYSHAGFEAQDEESMCSYDFYIGEIPQKVTELITDGFPFFRGKITLKQSIELDEENIILKLPGRYLTAKICVNGKEKRKLLFEKRIDISQFANVGSNEVEVEFTIGNRNMLGPLHNEDAEGFVWPGLYEQCSLAKSPDGKYRYRFYRFYKK